MKRNYQLAFATLAGLCLTPAPLLSQTFPSFDELLNNTYHVETGDFILNQEDYADYFTGEFDFRIAGTSLSPMVENFLYEGGNFNCNYEPSSGVLTITTITLKPTAQSPWLAFAPAEGGFHGITLASGNPLRLSVNEEGELMIPDFEVGTFSASPEPAITEIYAGYKNIITEFIGKDIGPDEVAEKSFAGRYSFTGVKTDYTDPSNPVEIPFDFDLVIEYDETSNWPNRLVEIAGYTLTPEVVENKNTLYTIEGNTLAYMTALSNGVIFELEPGVSTDDPEVAYVNSYNFGSENTRRWNQNDDSIIFTLESETEYSLQPFTIWHNYWTEQENIDENGEIYNTIINVKELVMKWEGEMAGIEEIQQDENTGPVRYFNLNGVEISNPREGIFIKLHNGKAVKQILK